MASLFASQFPVPDPSAWQTQAQKEAGTYENLRWATDEGFTLEPYYSAADLSGLPLTTIQAAQKPIPGWLNAPEYPITNDKADNLRLRDALNRGANALVLTLTSMPDLAMLLNGIKLSDTPVFFRFDGGEHSPDAVEFIQTLKTIAPYQLRGGLLTDSAANLASLVRQTADSPQFRVIGIRSDDFHNAGATATQEIAFSLAHLTDLYDTLTDDGLPIDELIAKTMLSISVGTSYFPEIAKLRAFRVLVDRFLAYYEPSVHQSLFIHAQTSVFYDAITSPYTNLLRATTEAMAALIGGCDALTVYPYDRAIGAQPGQRLSERLARNIPLLLREESLLDKVADPSAGSYYLETLTHQLTESAWNLFLTVEQRGGYQKSLADGFIGEELTQSYQRKQEAVRQGRVLVGVTAFRESTDPVAKPEKLASAGKLFPVRRLAEAFDE